ncbi:hypothetical protein KM043_002861 [Ampulex compressa]|nr:hypothetical protein KM043_002861 [Ampulex compressa]
MNIAMMPMRAEGWQRRRDVTLLTYERSGANNPISRGPFKDPLLRESEAIIGTFCTWGRKRTLASRPAEAKLRDSAFRNQLLQLPTVLI